MIIAIAGTFQNSGVKDYIVLHVSQAANGGGAETPKSRDNESGPSPYQQGPGQDRDIQWGALRVEDRCHLPFSSGGSALQGWAWPLYSVASPDVESPSASDIQHLTIASLVTVPSLCSTQFHTQILHPSWSGKSWTPNLSWLQLSPLLFGGNRKQLSSSPSGLVHLPFLFNAR